ncbi:MAG: cobalt-precorrin-5B (C(1))-methyltransferase [Desulfobacteraceae bacterium]|nr:cobalt-precorrin-5B (C(1))-methyltransferase [Desulfobacteraceae bacterium]
MGSKPLKKGFTTGTAAAASVKGALIFLFSSKKAKQVEIRFLTGEKTIIKTHQLKKLSKNSCQCSVVKDAGDDPDITHKAEIGARVCVKNAKSFLINIKGSQGVGHITKPGLELDVGEPAINPGPRKMILESIKWAFKEFDIKEDKQVDVEIFVPKGETLARKTLNARLGIIGGISILGTTGIVKPLSHEAYIATIRSGISVAAAKGIDTLVYTTGRRSERFAMDLFPKFCEEAFIQTGDFFKASIDEAVKKKEISSLIFTVFFGKAVKMSLGYEHTHAAKSKMTMKTLSQWAYELTKDIVLKDNIAAANTARHAFSYIHPKFDGLISFVGNKIKENAATFSKEKLKIRCIIFDFEGNVVFDSK